MKHTTIIKILKCIAFISLCASISVHIACQRRCDIQTNRPTDVKPIDWENYNDVYTVYWNYASSYSKRKQEDEGRIIKISGWHAWSFDKFVLCDDDEYYWAKRVSPVVHIDCWLPEFREFRANLDTSDLTKKCFVKGVLRFDQINIGLCTNAEPSVEIIDINDIYFK